MSGKTYRLMQFPRFAAGALVLLAVGCSSVKVVPKTEPSSPLKVPSVIHIRPFDTSGGKWEGTSAGTTARAHVCDLLAGNLESRLTEIAAAKIVAVDATPAEGWLVTGRFLRVNPGNKFARFAIGLGAGGSKLETEVKVYDLGKSATEPILVFQTTGGSNQEGGMVGLDDATANDVDRTSREIRDFLKARLGLAITK